ncbi:MAG TPA: hypothetical protein VJZ91_08910, partial [Blastocatellia bacterium]|nr:hypothetical protein [Blastocatellia bacterium]
MRRFVLILIALILIVAALGLPAAGGQGPKPAPGQSLTISARVGEVSRLNGEVRVKRRGGAEPQALQAGDTLVEGDVLTTGQQGRAEWTMRPGSYFQIGQNSRVRID